jgi:hypothetical protein
MSAGNSVWVAERKENNEWQHSQLTDDPAMLSDTAYNGTMANAAKQSI